MTSKAYITVHCPVLDSIIERLDQAADDGRMSDGQFERLQRMLSGPPSRLVRVEYVGKSEVVFYPGDGLIGLYREVCR